MHRSHQSTTNPWATLRRGLQVPTGVMLLAALGACGGGSNSTMMNSGATAQSCNAATCGAAIATMTDAAGDFLTYQVGLVSLQLKQADGTVVETLPVSTSVDLVQLVNLSEVISTAQIPGGEYVSALVTVDFSAASIMVDNGNGSGVAVSPVDASGAPLGKLQLNVQLDPKHDLHVNAGKASRIAFDFNLQASNRVDLAKHTVTVSPVLIAGIVAVDNRQVRVRGALAGVDTAAGTYTVQVAPFHDKGDDKQTTLIVHTGDTTPFEINGTPFSGAAGLAQLADLPANTMTVAFGALQTTDQSFIAARVLAGTSVEGPNLDHVAGSVIARTGNTLTVHGVHFDDRDGSHDFEREDATVSVGASTAVTTEGQMTATPAHSIAELSIGSRIDAFGTATRDAGGKLTMDSTVGHVRLDFTRLQGVLSSTAAGQITVALNNIDRQPVSLFNFAGTGTTAPQDSDPGHYLLTTGNLDLTAFAAGNPLLGIGLVMPFGGAPPDFNAVTLANGALQIGGEDGEHGGMDLGGDAQMEIDWGDAGTVKPFKSLDAAHLDVDIANTAIGQKHFIEFGPTVVDLKSLASDPSIVPDSSGMTLFAITHQHGNGIENFNDFADFEATMATELRGSVMALRLDAEGRYDAAGNTFSARRVSVRLSD